MDCRQSTPGSTERPRNLIALTEGSKRRLCKSDCAVIPNALRLKAVLCEAGALFFGGRHDDDLESWKCRTWKNWLDMSKV